MPYAPPTEDTLKTRIRTAAAADEGLRYWLGTSPFRWTEGQKPQGMALPCITVLDAGGAPTYVCGGRLKTGSSRWSFTIWGAGPDSRNAVQVERAFKAFLDQLNLTGITGMPRYPNEVVMSKDATYPWTQPPIFQRLVDVRIFAKDV